MYHDKFKKYYKPVTQKSDDGKIIATFESVKSASELTGTSYTSICAVTHGKRKRAGGYKWEFQY